MYVTIYFQKILYLIKFNASVTEPVIFISEKNEWAIKYVGQNLTDSINNINSRFMKITSSPKYYQNKVIHFGSQYMWVDWWKVLPKNNNYLVSFFHGKKEDGKETSVRPKADKLALEEYFFAILPTYDEDRVYASDMKKILSWYNLLLNSGT